MKFPVFHTDDELDDVECQLLEIEDLIAFALVQRILGLLVKAFTSVNPMANLGLADDFMRKFYEVLSSVTSPEEHEVRRRLVFSRLAGHPYFGAYRNECIQYMLFHWLRSLFWVDICPSLQYGDVNCPPTLCLRWRRGYGADLASGSTTVTGILVLEKNVLHNQNYSQTWRSANQKKQVMIGVARFANHVCWRERQLVPSVILKSAVTISISNFYLSFID